MFLCQRKLGATAGREHSSIGIKVGPWLTGDAAEAYVVMMVMKTKGRVSVCQPEVPGRSPIEPFKDSGI